MKKKILTPTQATLQAAMLSRRAMLKSAAALGAVGLAEPALHQARALVFGRTQPAHVVG